MPSMPRFFSLLLCVLLFSTSVFAQSADDHKNIRAAVNQKSYPAAIELLKQLRTADRNAFEINNYDYLLARMLELNGNVAEAASVYQSIATRGSVLRPYALWH